MWDLNSQPQVQESNVPLTEQARCPFKTFIFHNAFSLLFLTKMMRWCTVELAAWMVGSESRSSNPRVAGSHM